MVNPATSPGLGAIPTAKPGRRSPTRKIFLGLGLLAVLTVGPLALGLGVGIWLPDLFFNSAHIVSEATSADGQRFRVVQYWNHVDFYTTELRHTRPDGVTKNHLIDGDDFKEWGANITLDEKAHVVTVVLPGNRTKTVYWDY